MVGFMCLEELTVAANSVMLPDHMFVYIDRSVVEDVKLTKRDVEKVARMLIMVKETQLQTCKKVAFLSKMRDHSSTTEKIISIRSRMQAARDRQKSYDDVRRKPLEFQVWDKVMLKVSPWKGMIHFGKGVDMHTTQSDVHTIKSHV
ncbi:hypothetical protein Tco_0519687 [Tanacetum coccineum]